MNEPAKTLRRFWNKVNKTDGCWEWTAYKNEWGYGTFYFNQTMSLANRVSWVIHFGEIPTGMCVCHRCDNPACVKPEHLWIGTNLENAKDCIRKGRKWSGKGELHPLCKLSNSKVLKIRRLFSKGRLSQIQIGRRFGVANTLISQIVRNEIWTHI